MMKNKRLLLLRNLLKSTSEINIYKHTTDKKKRTNIIGNMVGYGVVFVMIVLYCGIMAIGLGYSDRGYAIPELAASLMLAMPFLFTLLKTNGYLFAFKEYDMLMAMPFSVKNIVACKFLYMYVQNLKWILGISLSMLIGYTVTVRFDLWIVFSWIVLTFVFPLIPMILASALGALIAGIGSSFKYKKLVQIVLIFIAVVPLMFSQFFVEKLGMDGELNAFMGEVAGAVDSVSGVLVPAKWFRQAVLEKNYPVFAIIIAVTIAAFELFFTLVSKSYRKINSKLMSASAHKKYSMKAQKQHSMVRSIAFKEFKRAIGSTTYATNAFMGQFMALVFGIVVVIMGKEKLVSTLNVPIALETLLPALPIFVYFFVGMVTTTAISPSTEGKNYWIIQSLPINPMDDCKGKMLFNLIVSIPIGVSSVILFSIGFGADIWTGITGVIEIIALCLLSTVFGLVCGIKHRRLDWENEIEVIKQGPAISSYLLPNMIVSMVLIGGVVYLGALLSPVIINIAITVAGLILTWIAWLRLDDLVKEN